MSRRFWAIILSMGAMSSACGEGAAPPATPPVPIDPASYANVGSFVVTHLGLDLTANFERRVLSGTAELLVDRRDAAATELILDTRDLAIEKVEAGSADGAWSATTHALDPATPAFGRALRIAMPAGATRVRITYATVPAARGLQWLTPAQTAGKTQPFLFSQAQAIQARSFIPLQDTPAVRVTYDAVLHVPRPLVAVMAAEAVGGDPGAGVFRFRMPQAIPSYLIALAIGDLTFRRMSDRTGVWAEPSVVDAAAQEFADTERMMQAAEALYGPYRWVRYDLLVLPPSFPFGGMENPRLTFATPTILAGDKSLVSLVAHELAHSWSGNLVTNATAADFWLNEGFTTYLERRIVEAVYGRARADMEAMIGVRDLEEARKTLDVPGDRTLQPDLAGRDPDDAYSTVPYEQGALLLVFLEAKFGRDAFDAFLRKWFDTHAFQSVTTADFLTFLQEELMDSHPGVVTDAQIQEYRLRSERVPAFAVLPRSDAFTRVEAARDAWLRGGAIDALASPAAAWSTQEWVHFYDSLPRRLAPAQLAALDRRFTPAARNAEIAHVWYRLAIANDYQPAYAAMEQYMTRIGRRKLIVPLYRDLAATPAGLARARRIYDGARAGYHPMAQDAVEDILK